MNVRMPIIVGILTVMGRSIVGILKFMSRITNWLLWFTQDFLTFKAKMVLAFNIYEPDKFHAQLSLT